MKMNRDPKTYKLPFKVVLLDAQDAFYYADIMGRMEEFDTIADLKIAKALANALFVVKNYKWESLDDMNDVDGGWDVRVYDSALSCVHAAHEVYKDNWIGS